MKIMLIVPPLSLQEIYGNLKLAGTLYPSLGLASIAAIGERAGYKIKVLDSEAMNYSYTHIEKEIRSYKPDLIGMQAFCNTIEKNNQIAMLAKKIDPSTKIVYGGVHATLFPVECIKNVNVNYLIQGEGEVAFENLLKALEGKTSFKKVKSLVWKEEREIIANPRAELIQNLDALPLPARHLFPMTKYHSSANLRGRKTLNIISSRGCPNRCVYCSSPLMFGKTYRWNSAKRVVEEVEQLKNVYGIDSIQFSDDNFTLNEKRVFELCDQIIAEKIKMPWTCLTRVNLVNRELLQKMKEAGCYQIFYGVESGVQRLLDLLKKDITLEQIKNAFKLTKKAGIESLAAMMLAIPTETIKDVEETIKFALELDPDYTQWQKAIPYPGNELYDIALKHGRLLTNDFSKYTVWNEVIYLPHNRTKEEIEQSIKKAYKKFYLRPSYLFKRLKMLRRLSWQNQISLIRTILKIILK